MALKDDVKYAYDGGRAPYDGRRGGLHEAYESEPLDPKIGLVVDSRFYDVSAFTEYKTYWLRNKRRWEEDSGDYDLELLLARMESEMGAAHMVGQEVVLQVVPRDFFTEAFVARVLRGAEDVVLSFRAVEVVTEQEVIPPVDLDFSTDCHTVVVGELPQHLARRFNMNDHVAITMTIKTWPADGLYGGVEFGKRPGALLPQMEPNGCSDVYPVFSLSTLGRDACFRIEDMECDPDLWPESNCRPADNGNGGGGAGGGGNGGGGDGGGDIPL